GQLTMKLGAIPGGQSGLAVVAPILYGHIAAPQNRVGRGLERPLMGYRDSVRNLRYIPEIGRGAILHRARDTATVPALSRRRGAGRQQHAQTKENGTGSGTRQFDHSPLASRMSSAS